MGAFYAILIGLAPLKVPCKTDGTNGLHIDAGVQHMVVVVDQPQSVRAGLVQSADAAGQPY